MRSRCSASCHPIMRDKMTPHYELVRMRLSSLFAVWLVFSNLLAAQETPKANIRFFNDSAKAVNFYVDGQLGCAIAANPEGTTRTVTRKRQTHAERKRTTTLSPILRRLRWSRWC